MKALLSHPLRNDGVKHPIDQGHIRPWLLLEQRSSIVGQLDSSWIGHDQFGLLLSTAALTSRAITGWFSVVFEPMTKMQSAFLISAMELVMAPLPKAIARPATVELCQRRAQWSTLFVPRAARAIFWRR